MVKEAARARRKGVVVNMVDEVVLWMIGVDGVLMKGWNVGGR